jgi:hypothetical protein
MVTLVAQQFMEWLLQVAVLVVLELLVQLLQLWVEQAVVEHELLQELL